LLVGGEGRAKFVGPPEEGDIRARWAKDEPRFSPAAKQGNNEESLERKKRRTRARVVGGVRRASSATVRTTYPNRRLGDGETRGKKGRALNGSGQREGKEQARKANGRARKAGQKETQYPNERGDNSRGAELFTKLEDVARSEGGGRGTVTTRRKTK